MGYQPPTALRMVPLTLVMGTIFFLSHQPGSSMQIELPPGADKVGHLVIYAVLAATFIFSLVGVKRAKYPGRLIILTLFFSFFYGLSDEFHQSFIPGRFVSGFDLLADCLGAALSCFLWLKLVQGQSKDIPL